MHVDIPSSVRISWLVFTVFWAVSALRVRRTARAEPLPSRLIHSCLLLGAFALLFTDGLRVGPLAWRVVPAAPAVELAGAVLAALGIALAIWARLFLGQNWSAAVTIKEEHRLVRSGPYALVRHPIYAGILVAMLGTALAVGEVRGLVAVVLALIAWVRKSRIEEEWLLRHFGEEYARYRHQVKALIPLVY
jgi:protein-S-isoprenylcysteine O-methyltransferase Ste14